MIKLLVYLLFLSLSSGGPIEPLPEATNLINNDDIQNPAVVVENGVVDFAQLDVDQDGIIDAFEAPEDVDIPNDKSADFSQFDQDDVSEYVDDADKMNVYMVDYADDSVDEEEVQDALEALDTNEDEDEDENLDYDYDSLEVNFDDEELSEMLQMLDYNEELDDGEKGSIIAKILILSAQVDALEEMLYDSEDDYPEEYVFVHEDYIEEDEYTQFNQEITGNQEIPENVIEPEVASADLVENGAKPEVEDVDQNVAGIVEMEMEILDYDYRQVSVDEDSDSEDESTIEYLTYEEDDLEKSDLDLGQKSAKKSKSDSSEESNLELESSEESSEETDDGLDFSELRDAQEIVEETMVERLFEDTQFINLVLFLGLVLGLMMLLFGLLSCLVLMAHKTRPQPDVDPNLVKNVKLAGIVKSYARLPTQIRNMKPTNVPYKELYNNNI